MHQGLKTDYICKIFNVTHVTVITWIKKGKLAAFTTGGGHYRIMPHDLVDFLKKKGRPIPVELKSAEEVYRVLIVDDEENIIYAVRLMLETMIEDMGINIEIETATDGLDAGIKLGTFMPHLVVLDCLMSENNDNKLNYFDGNIVVKKIRGNPKLSDIKILVFTGYPEEGERLLKLGADKLVIKGANIDAFQKEVCQLLGIKFNNLVPKSS